MLGVIGKSKFAFDVWGNTINYAARLESYRSPDWIHMTKATYVLWNEKEEKVEEKSIEIRLKDWWKLFWWMYINLKILADTVIHFKTSFNKI